MRTARVIATTAMVALAAAGPARAQAPGQVMRTSEQSAEAIAAFVAGIAGSVTAVTIVSYSNNLKETVTSGAVVLSLSAPPGLGRIDIRVQNGSVYAIPTTSVWYVLWDDSRKTLQIFLK